MKLVPLYRFLSLSQERIPSRSSMNFLLFFRRQRRHPIVDRELYFTFRPKFREGEHERKLFLIYCYRTGSNES